jgi:hypothetical protein
VCVCVGVSVTESNRQRPIRELLNEKIRELETA